MHLGGRVAHTLTDCGAECEAAHPTWNQPRLTDPPTPSSDRDQGVVSDYERGEERGSSEASELFPMVPLDTRGEGEEEDEPASAGTSERSTNSRLVRKVRKAG